MVVEEPVHAVRGHVVEVEPCRPVPETDPCQGIPGRFACLHVCTSQSVELPYLLLCFPVYGLRVGQPERAKPCLGCLLQGP